VYNKVEKDEEYIQRVKNGDCNAFSPLIERYKLPLYRVMYGMVRNRDDAEDLVEEAFIKAYRSIKRFETGRPFYVWLRRIAVNNAINFLRKERRIRTDPLEYVAQKLANGRNDPVAMTEQKLLQERINTAMARLPKEFRIILSLKVEEDMSYSEISEALKIPRGTVMSRLARARQKLKELLEQKEVSQHEM
jgi:RNA polymerase sigma-70 factor (ECF subfamily)